jgi:hypothetical protein
MLDLIPNESLRESDVPSPDASWDEIWTFALTFDGYAAHGSFDACAEIANQRRHETLSELRTCLFFEQRRWRNYWGQPEGDDSQYIRSLVEGIREHVTSAQAGRSVRMGAADGRWPSKAVHVPVTLDDSVSSERRSKMGTSEFAIGDYVFHGKFPGWGPGRVLDIAGPKITIYFRDRPGATEKSAVFKSTLGKAPLLQAPQQDDPVLDNLPPYRNGRFERVEQERVTLDEGLARFRAAFPLYFEDPAYIGDLKSGERAYKWARHTLFTEALGGNRLRELIDASRVEFARDKLLAVTKQVNLLSMYEHAALRDALKDMDAAKPFMLALDDLLRSGPSSQAEFEKYVDAIDALPAAEGKTSPAKWPVATLLPFLAEPSRFMFLKPVVTQKCADRLMFDLCYEPSLNWTTFHKLHVMSAYLLEQLRRYGARDFIDVQSFMFIIAQ